MESILAREGILGPTNLIEQVVFSQNSEILGVLVDFTLFAFTQLFLRSATNKGGIGENVKATASALTNFR